MSQPDPPDGPQGQVGYYVLVSDDSSKDDPDGLARRRHTPEGDIDESFRRDLTWQRTSVLFRWESGDVGTDVIEISEAEAMAIVERWRAEWQAADQP